MLALFGFFVCVGLKAPWWVFLIGFLCLCMESDSQKAKIMRAFRMGQEQTKEQKGP